MGKFKGILLGSVALLLCGYGAWTTVRLIRLEARLGELESSHRALGRYTYDFGAALLRTNDFAGFSGPQHAGIILLEMNQDELLQTAVHSSRTRTMLIGASQSPRNSVENVSQ